MDRPSFTDDPRRTEITTMDYAYRTKFMAISYLKRLSADETLVTMENGQRYRIQGRDSVENDRQWPNQRFAITFDENSVPVCLLGE